MLSEVASRTFACERQFVSASQHLELEQQPLRLWVRQKTLLRYNTLRHKDSRPKHKNRIPFFHTTAKMSRHHPDLVMCRKTSGISIGRLCDKCDGKCPVCDSYVRPTTLVRICDECSFGNYQNKCVVCGGEGISDAFYCFECTRLEKDRDGCPKIINLGSSRTDLFYQKKNFRNQ